MADVILVDYRPVWPEQFRAVASELERALAGAEAGIEHIGSTAVPGLCAKPVLDVLWGVADLIQADALIPALAGLGYRYRPEYETQLPERRYFVRPAGPCPRVHLHAVVHGGDFWRRHLAFRDMLSERPELAARYAALKRDLAVRHAHDKARYTEAKAPFIASVLAQAALSPPQASR